MRDLLPAPVLPEWEAPLVAEPVVKLIPLDSLAREILGRDILNLQNLGGLGFLLMVLIMWRRTVRRPFR